MNDSILLFLLSLASFCFGAIGSLIFGKHGRTTNYWAHIWAIIGSISGLVAASQILFSGSSLSQTIATSLPLVSVGVHIDGLAAVFLMIIMMIGVLVSIYAIGYLQHEEKSNRLGSLGFFYNIFLLSMALVVTASNAVWFLIVWELMSLASYFLVVHEQDNPETIRAGSLYFKMTHIGTAAIALLFLILFRQTGSFDFVSIHFASGQLSSGTLAIVSALALFGFGTKAGVIPFHIWLPGAHPAAPSHVSAIMSGVMIKTGIYMFIRLFWDVLPVPTVWLGIIVLALGAISAVLGVLYALTEHDIKRLLAYHSIENIGIILLGLGSSLIFLSLNLKVLALLGLVAALFHVCNHAIFKALLFMGAGSVISATHTRNMEQYGGLIRVIPQTALFFLTGSLAISAFPPFNGFFSEWLTFQSLINGISSMDGSVRFIFILAMGALALTSGLAAACFVKVFGSTFLARPRSEAVSQAKESAFSLQIGMAGMAVLTLIIGILSGPITARLASVLGNLTAFNGTLTPLTTGIGFLQTGPVSAIVSAPTIILVIGLAGLATMLFLLTQKQSKTRIAATWDCGSPLTPRHEITATGFARSLIMIFQGIVRPSQQQDVGYHDAHNRYTLHSDAGLQPIFRMYLYRPLESAVYMIAGHIRRIQSGNVNTYIFYIAAILAIVLAIIVR